MRAKRLASRTRSPRKALLLFTWCWLISLSPALLASAITIDGKLDEPEWQSARVWDQYVESIPFSLAEPKHTQKVLILEDEKGMYFGFISDQAKETVRTNQHQRDNERANSDKVGISIDFEGMGSRAMAFLCLLEDPSPTPSIATKIRATRIGTQIGIPPLLSAKKPGSLRCLFLGR